LTSFTSLRPSTPFAFLFAAHPSISFNPCISFVQILLVAPARCIQTAKATKLNGHSYHEMSKHEGRQRND
jgi:hypothetical protein